MTKQTCALTSMPLDILGIVLDSLELVDIKNTRLACKSLATIGPRFKSFIADQTTDLSVESLQNHRELASHPELGPAVKTMVVLAAAFDTSELDRMIKTKRRRIVEVNGPFTSTTEPKLTDDELAQAESDLAWMHAQQAHQRTQTIDESIDALAAVLRLYGTLDIIDLDACVIKNPRERVSTAQAGEWHPVFIRASEVYRITTSAIANSELSLNTLLIYRETPRCSVPSFDVTSHMAELEALPGFTSAFSSLENFALSFSTRVQTDFSKIEAARDGLEGAAAAYHNAMGSRAGQYSHENPEATMDDNFPGIAHMLCQMPRLDAFDLHMTNTLRGPSTVYHKILDHIADEVKLPSLTQVFFRGLPASEESLVKFIDNHQTISDLTIDEMRLTSGCWKRAIKHISQLPNLSKLRLSNLFNEQGVFNLLSKDPKDDEPPSDRPGDSYPCLRGVKLHTRVFGPIEIQRLREGLEFDDTETGRGLGSPDLMRWRKIREFKYSI
ncbi:hypothetical protein BKA64DRAFT_772512 [Cadophora sp. MPI-SDFR-AT-0126]|nr:hypothetical protein BKA64DRAFT_772512 [Leotiomycetes sp. MPI-SDFR-AT-0126]